MRALVVAAICGWLAAFQPTVAHAFGEPERTSRASLTAALDRLEPIAAAKVARVYQQTGGQLLWYGNAAATQRRHLAGAALNQAYRHGFDARPLQLGFRDELSSSREILEQDVALTNALLRYAEILRRGAADPKYLGQDWHIQAEPYDAVAGLTLALQRDTLGDFLNSLAPPHAQYIGLLHALEQYRQLSAGGGWPVIRGTGELKLDGSDLRLDVFRTRLVAEGYLRPERTGALAIKEAVAEFQRRHGLDDDGRVGRNTLRELNVPAESRAAQIAANLERWRQFPRSLPAEMVVVNAAGASLELVQAGQSSLRMRTVVGDRKHPTPVFSAHITGVTFNPPWNVPPSIAVKEMLPRLKRDRGYLEANNIVIVDRPEDPYGRSVAWSRLSGREFPYRLQQKPGSSNSLGVIKFEMANPWNVYLHDTPAKEIFARIERHRSHGCVRVQLPGELARRLLADEQRWNSDAIVAAIASSQTRTVALGRPVPVYIGYWTAFVDPDGLVNFRPDVYSRDASLIRALNLGADTRMLSVSSGATACSSGIPGSAPLAISG